MDPWLMVLMATYSANSIPENCESARFDVQLAMEYVSSAAVQLVSHVNL